MGEGRGELAGIPLRHGKWDIRDLIAWQALQPLAGRFVPWSDWSMRPSALLEVVNVIWVDNRRVVVELGGGPSTLFHARLQADLGGRVWVLENDSTWVERLRDALAREGLEETAKVFHAPLEEGHPHALDGNAWYAQSVIDEVVAEVGAIEALIVDGPSAFREERALARYPALPALREHLAENPLVVLDDIDRAGELQVVDRWEAETDLRFKRRHGIGIAISGRARG